MQAAAVTTREQFRQLLSLAIPVALGELGWMFMSVVDTVMLGRLGADAIAASSLAHTLFITVGLLGVGLLLGMDTLVSQAYGAGKMREAQITLWQGIWLALLLTPVAFVAAPLLLMVPQWLGHGAELRANTSAYLGFLLLGTLPLLLYAAFRRYLQSMSLVRPVMLAIVSANLVNWLGNEAFIFGKFGAPQMGVPGSGLATTLARLYMAVFLAVAVALHTRGLDGRLWPQFAGPAWWRLRQLLALGGPAAGQIGLEVGIFSLATLAVSTLGTVTLAAHQIALNVASVTYMVPLGISSATAVAVGQAVGRKDREGAAKAGWMGIGLGAGFMALSGLLLFVFPRTILGLYTSDQSIVPVGVGLLFLAALFQFFDGVQITATGALRGVGDTRTPMLANLAGHWVVGLPVAYVSGFVMRGGAHGVWIGLSLGLLLVSLVLLWWWRRSVGRMKGAKTGILHSRI